MRLTTIQIVTYNNATTIQSTLESVLALVGQAYEVIVVDNASEDDTVEKVAPYPVRLICNPRNVGYAAAHNQAIRLGTGDYVLTLNPDAYLTPEFLQHTVCTLEQFPTVGAVSGKLLRVNELDDMPESIDSAGLWMRRNRRQGLRYENAPIDYPPADQPCYIFGPDGAAAVYRRRMLQEISMDGEVFDEDFFIQKEDVDLCWRMQLHGWQARYVPQAVAYHVRTFRPGKRQSVKLEVRFYAVRNRYLMALKNEIGANFWQDAWSILPYDLLIILYLLIWERPSLKAFCSVWALRRRMHRKRRLIHASRTVSARQMQQWFRGKV